MREEIIAKRYAEGFLDYVKDKIGIEKAHTELENIRTILSLAPELKNFFYSSAIAFAEKCSFIDKVFKDYLSNETITFLKFLLEKNRINVLNEIIDYVKYNYKKEEEIYTVIKTAYPVGREILGQIKDKLEKKLKKKLDINPEIDKQIIGGMEIIMGNYIIDGSVIRQITDLEDTLKETRVV